MTKYLTILAALFSSGAFAHTIFQRVHVNGVDQGYLKGVRHPTYNGPITDVTSNDVICNGGPNPLVTPFPSDIINIPAGARAAVQFNYMLQPNGYSGGGSDPIDPSHKGPVMVYLAKIDDARSSTVTGLRWFKIFEDGFDGSRWGVDRLISNRGVQEFTVPSCIPSGNYLLRAELIALHGAGTYPGAQLYMGCAQVNIVGGGSASPATVSFPGAYRGSDPGITVNIYYPPLTSYTIPGPRPFTCSGTQPQPTTARPPSSTARPPSSTARPPSSTARPPSSTARPPSSSAGSTTGAPLYGQCGGQGWTGATTCAQGTCTYSNQWYSQCLP